MYLLRRFEQFKLFEFCRCREFRCWYKVHSLSLPKTLQLYECYNIVSYRIVSYRIVDERELSERVNFALSEEDGTNISY